MSRLVVFAPNWLGDAVLALPALADVVRASPAGAVDVAATKAIAATVRSYRFDRVYGGWWDRVIDRDGAAAVERSAYRYIRWIEGRAGEPGS